MLNIRTLQYNKVYFYNIAMRETSKFNLWAKYFMDESNRECFGNATKSAIKAYGYTSPKQYHLASVTGSKNMRKYENLAMITCDMEGFSFAELLKIGIKKMLDGNYNDWERFMSRIGYSSERPESQFNTQVNFNLGDAIAASRKERELPA